MDIGIIILAIIQGIAEFLPISSSAHLIIFRDLFGIGANTITGEMALIFDIALHFGTLLAIVVYFFSDFVNMFFKGISKGIKDNEGKVFWFIVVATIPAALAGYFFEDVIEEAIRTNFILIAVMLILVGLLIYLVDKKFNQEKDIKSMTFKDAILIGIGQMLALIPGFSRSGITITAGRMLKLKREDSAKFAFYLAAPVIFGATMLHLFKDDTINVITSNLPIFFVGILIAFIAGLLCIEFLLSYLRKRDFKIFMIYRIILGVVVIVYTLIK